MARIDEILDEASFGQALRQLCDPQPSSPVDRLDAVTSRAQSIRRRRTSVGALAGVVLVAMSVMIVSWWPTTPPQPLAGSPVATWPDRSTGTELGIAGGVLREYTHRTGNPTSSVRWLYRGAVVPSGPNPIYVVVFLAPADGPGQQLVLAYANRVLIDAAGDPITPSPGYSPWIIRQSPTQSMSVPIHVGFYFPVGVDSHEVIFVLADPATRQLRYTPDPLPYATGAIEPEQNPTTTAATLDSVNGVFVAEVGALVGPLRVVMIDEAGHSSPEATLGFAGAQATLAKARQPNLPATFTMVSALSGTTERQDNGSIGAVVESSEVAHGAARWSAYARCYGGGNLTVKFQTTEGNVACDGLSHQVIAPTAYPVIPGYTMRLTSDTIQGYHVVLGTTP